MKNNNDDKYDIKKFHWMITDSINRRDNAGGECRSDGEWMNDAIKMLGERELVDDTACKGEERVLTAVDDLAEEEEF
jgi:hypothetical protein